METYLNFVNSALRTREGQPPKRSFVTQAFTGACLLRNGAFGIETYTQAAFACGVPPGYVAAATVIMDACDDNLTNSVLYGRVSMFAAAKQVKTRAALIAAYRDASPTDKADLGRTVGPDTVWDQAVIPALNPVVTSTVVPMSAAATAASAPKTNGKTDGNGSHPHAGRPVAPVIVPIDTHH